jgi:hypothetical protein
MDSRNFAIGVLSTTAVILLVGVLVIGSRPAPALGQMTVTKGDYIITVGNSPQLDEEFVYVIDVPEQKLVVYRFNTPRQQIDMLQGIDLNEMRESGPSGPGSSQRP